MLTPRSIYISSLGNYEVFSSVTNPHPEAKARRPSCQESAYELVNFEDDRRDHGNKSL